MRQAILAATTMSLAPAENDLSKAQLMRGDFYLAENSFSASNFFHEPLTIFAAGGPRNEDVGPEALFISPEVRVQTANGLFEYMDHSAGMGVQSELDDTRPIGSDFKEVDETGSLVATRVLNRGLASIIDEDRFPDWQTEAQNRITKILDRLDLNRARRAYAIHLAAAANTTKVWGGAAQCEADARAELTAGATASGIRCNRVVYGESAWNLRKSNYESQNNAGSNASARMKVEDVATELMLASGRVSRLLHQDGSSTFSRAISTKVLFFKADNNPSIDDTSHVKTFYANTASGGRYRVLMRQVSDKIHRVVVECYEVQRLTGTLSNSIRTLEISAS
jgi:hypothetical protein